jgi:hypothetical protein
LALKERRQRQRVNHVPQESEALWTFIHGLSHDERMDVLAHLRVADRQCGSRSAPVQ